MVWADDDFSYFYWLNRLSKFGHGVVPDHVSFSGIFFFLYSELDGLCPRPSICRQNKNDSDSDSIIHMLIDDRFDS